MLVVRNLLPLGVAGLVAALMLPRPDLAGLVSSPAAEDAAPRTQAESAQTPAAPRDLPNYVVLRPEPVEPAPDVAGLSADRAQSLPPPAVSPEEFASSLQAADVAEDTVPEPLPADETATGSIPNGAEPTFVGQQAVNMRVGPSTNTARITVLQPGDAVSVLDTNGGWAYVATKSGETGWVYSSYLGNTQPPPPARADAGPATASPPPAAAQPSAAGPEPTRITSPGVYADPSTSSERLFLLRPGEGVRIVERRGNWARVVLQSGITGWVRVN